MELNSDDFLNIRVGNKLLLGGFSVGTEFQLLLSDFDAFDTPSVNWFDESADFVKNVAWEGVYILRADGDGRSLAIDLAQGRLTIINIWNARMAITIPFTRDDYMGMVRRLVERIEFLREGAHG